MGAIPKKYTESDSLCRQNVAIAGDSSRQLMQQSLDQDVTVYYRLCETGSEDAIITVAGSLRRTSGHFHWEQKDPALYPTLQRSTAQSDASTRQPDRQR